MVSLRFSVGFIFLAACVPNFDLPAGGVIACTTEGDCPAALRCNTSIGECVPEGDARKAPGITANPSADIETTEAGGSTTVAIVLDAEPAADVIVPVISSREDEATVEPSSLAFAPTNWDTPQSVTVRGVRNCVDDGDTPFVITVGPAASEDPDYDGLEGMDIGGINRADGEPGLSIDPITGLETSEAGGDASFTIRLRCQPLADVELTIVSLDPSEGIVTSPASGIVVYTAQTWQTPINIIVSGVDDAVDDGDIPYHVQITSSSADPRFHEMDLPLVSLVNLDNDEAGFTTDAVELIMTDENGGQAAFGVQLTSEPTAEVTVPVAVSNHEEVGLLEPATSELVFDSTTWDIPQTVIIEGLPDQIDDGDQSFEVLFGPMESADPKYAGLTPASVTGININVDQAALVVVADWLSVDEIAKTATFTVQLATRPVDGVTVIPSAPPNSVSINVPNFSFDESTWTQPQTGTVSGIAVAGDDGPENFEIALSASSSADAVYASIEPVTVSGTKHKNATRRLFVTAGTNGNLGGIPGADATCNASTAKPNDSYYKALLVAPGVRRACSTDNCSGGTVEHLDWVLWPNTTYTRADGTVSFATNANGILLSDLTVAISTIDDHAWTGLNGNTSIGDPTPWTTATAATCLSWTSASGPHGDSGAVGKIDDTRIAWAFSGGYPDCHHSRRLICVEQ